MNDLTLSQEEIDAMLFGDTVQKKSPTQVLTRQEIDELLVWIGDDEAAYDFVDSSGAFQPEQFFSVLTEKSLQPEPRIGMFTKDPAVSSFKSDRHADQVLADIRDLNEKQGGGNISIPGTKIELINFSKCPTCGKIFSYKDLKTYYQNPVQDPDYSCRGQQFRLDTRIHCDDCGGFFLPSLVIVDGTPKNEVQFLCRVQTINAAEQWVSDTLNRSVLSRVPSNYRVIEGRNELLNDLEIAWLTQRPSLILNIVQYSTPPAILNLLAGKNREQGDAVYGRATA